MIGKKIALSNVLNEKLFECREQRKNYFQSSNRVQLCLSGARNVRNYLDETKGNPVSGRHVRELHFCISAGPLKREASGWMRWRVRQRNSNHVYMYVGGQLSVV